MRSVRASRECHNEAGLFRFPDGSFLSLPKMWQECVSAKRLCVFLSCRAQDYFRLYKVRTGIGSQVDLSYREALGAARNLGKKLALRSGDPKRNPIEFEGALQSAGEKSVDGAQTRAKIENFAVISGAGGAAGLVATWAGSQ